MEALNYNLLHKIVCNNIYEEYAVEVNNNGATFQTVGRVYNITNYSKSFAASFKEELNLANNPKFKAIIKIIHLEEYNNKVLVIFHNNSANKLFEEKKLITKISEIIDLFLDVLIFLDKLHLNKTSHNSLNPENIWIDTNTHSVGITGFGEYLLWQNNNGNGYMRENLNCYYYISPEQTGILNRNPDYRTDYYSLGVMFYELITGNLPFYKMEKQEIMHYHIAKQFTDPLNLNSEVPAGLSAVIMKMLEKDPEKRYRSAGGIISDLKSVQNENNGFIDDHDFIPGTKDFSYEFLFPEKLFGKDKELDFLINLFEKVKQGNKEFIFISGLPGTGKTALVNAMRQHVASNNGLFIYGKFDQYKKDIPYSAIIEAFSQLVKRILTYPESVVKEWKLRILKAVGNNGQVIIDVIPDVEIIIGSQPAVPELGPEETRNRFNMVIKNFTRCFLDKEHPLVLFLDDLQWVDLASIDYMSMLVKSSDISSILGIWAYRNNEVDKNHPLMKTVSEDMRAGFHSHNLILDALTKENIKELLVTIFAKENQDICRLAKVVHNKTHGNPFYVKQFLKTLYHKGIIHLDSEMNFQWDLQEVIETHATENVVEFLIDNIKSLKPNEKELLKICSVVGSSFELDTIAGISSADMTQVLDDIKIPVQNCYLMKKNNQYIFHHDRIHEAIYSQIDEKQKLSLHYKVGKSLIPKIDLENPSDLIFDAAGHLNKALYLIRSEEEIQELAEINYRAGLKAKSNAAYETAINNFNNIVKLNVESGWTENYTLMYDIHLLTAQCQYSLGKTEDAIKVLDTALQNARDDIDRANIHKWKCVVYTSIFEHKEAVREGLTGLRILGINISVNTNKWEVIKNEFLLKLQKGFKRIEDIHNLQEMKNPKILLILDLGIKLFPSIFHTYRPNAYILISLICMRLILMYGISDYSIMIIFGYAHAISDKQFRYKTAYRYGRMALKMMERTQNPEILAPNYQTYCHFIHHLKNHFQDSEYYMEKAIKISYENGIIEYIGFSLNVYFYSLFFSGSNLNYIIKKYNKYNHFIEQCRNVEKQPLRFFYKSFLHYTNDIDLFDSVNATMLAKIENYLVNCSHIQSIGVYIFLKAGHTLLFNDTHINPIDIIRLYDKSFLKPSFFLIQEIFFNFSLLICKIYNDVNNSNDKTFIKKKLREYHKWYKRIGTQAPVNYLHKYLLISAEIARIKGKYKKAAKLYDKAIDNACKNKFIQNEALGRELAGKFYLEINQTEKAGEYLKTAAACYEKWGAARKVEIMKEEYKDIFNSTIDEKHIDKGEQQSNFTQNEYLSLLKANQIISREIQIEPLMKNLMKVINEHIGASKSILLLNKRNIPVVRVIDKEDADIPQLVNITADECYELSSAVINYSMRTGEKVAFTNKNLRMFSECKYLKKNKPASVLCFPISTQKRVIGFLYLENQYIADAFTVDKVDTLYQISIQAAISLENALLYEELQKSDNLLKQANEQLEHKVLDRTKDLAKTNEELHEKEKRIEDMYTRLQRSHEDLLSVLNKQEIAIFLTDENALITYANDRLLTLIDKSFSHIKGQAWHEIFSFQEVHRQKIEENMKLDEIKRETIVVEYSAAKGKLYYLEIHIKDDPRNPASKIFMINDISEIYNLRKRLDKDFSYQEIIGKSEIIQGIFQQIEQIAIMDCTVLIEGETGTGKELAARAIHNRSSRKEKPFIAVNCAGLTDSILSSQLFGHKKGAFTGASSDHRGFFESADSGTIFLDEIGDISQSVQASLLRILETGEYYRLGDSTIRKVNVRVISATNKDLNHEIETGNFRKDLYFRLKVASISLPPLTKRRDDIPLITSYFLEQNALESGSEKKYLTKEVMNRLMEYDWPGNVRELKNSVLYAIIHSSGNLITEKDLPPEILTPPSSNYSYIETRLLSLAENAEMKQLVDALDKAKGSRKKTAKLLGISRATLFRRMKKYGLLDE